MTLLPFLVFELYYVFLFSRIIWGLFELAPAINIGSFLSEINFYLSPISFLRHLRNKLFLLFDEALRYNFQWDLLIP